MLFEIGHNCIDFFSTSCADYLDIVPDDIATIEKSFNNRAAAERFFLLVIVICRIRQIFGVVRS